MNLNNATPSIEPCELLPLLLPEVSPDLICPKGHGRGHGRFCTTCGSKMIEGALAKNAPEVLNVDSPNRSKDCLRCGNGKNLRDNEVLCFECHRLKPIAHGFSVHPATFQWAQDGQAMQKLQSIRPLASLAKSVSGKVGSRWIESTFNGIRLNNRQLPNVYGAAVHAARVLGLEQMPEVYVSGDQPWNMMTFGSDERSFIVIGSALAANFHGQDLVFLFAREIGHILAGHALWKTVLRFLVGDSQARNGLMKNGVVGLLDPMKWIESAIEVPLLSWARQAEITADRAGLLAVGDFRIAQRTLFSWAFKSPVLYQRINLQEWSKQQSTDSLDEGVKLAELVSSATPYITRRLKLLDDYQHDSVVKLFRNNVQAIFKKNAENRNSSPTNNSVNVPFIQEPIHGKLSELAQDSASFMDPL